MTEDTEPTTPPDGDRLEFALTGVDDTGPVVSPRLARRLTIGADRYEITVERCRGHERSVDASSPDRFTFACLVEDTERFAGLDMWREIHPGPRLPADAYATSREALDAGEARLRWKLANPEAWWAEEEALWARVEAKRQEETP